MKMDIKGRFTSKAFKVGGYSAIAAFIVAAMAVLIILIVDRIPASFTKLDLTDNRIFSVSDNTKEFLSELDKEVTIFWIVQNGQEDTTLEQMLQTYESLSPNIKVEKKDPVVYPNFTDQYTSEDVYDNSLVVMCKDVSKFVSYYDIYTMDSFDYTTYSYTYSFDGEGKITSAIDYVTSENRIKAYLLNGHGENLNDTVRDAISQQNMELADLNLLSSESVPEDAQCLIISAPTSDLSDEEAEKILAYLEDGGSLLLITDYLDEDTPNLEALMESYGVEKVNGLVMEGDANHNLSGYPYYLLPNIESHSITSDIKDDGYYVLMPLAHGIRETESHRNSLEISPLLTTSDKAYIKPDAYNLSTVEKEAGDEEGTFYLGAAITETVEDTVTNVVWIANSAMFESDINEMVGGSNVNLFMNSLNWMCHVEDSIVIPSKSLSVESLTLSAGTGSRYSVLFIGIVPVLFIITGLAVWTRRKRR